MYFEKRIATFIFSILIATSTSAANNQTGSGPNPYRDCGIGSALFEETAWAAVTSNVIWDLGITALISATASPETCSGKNIKTAQFIIDNYENLIEETAKGQGEHLVAMLDIQGCDTKTRNETSLNIRRNMSPHIISESYVKQELTEKATNYYNSVISAASANCSS